jgi:hypothetical protein
MLEYLFDLGRQRADAWVGRHGADIGHRSTFDLQTLLPMNFWSTDVLLVAQNGHAVVTRECPLSGGYCCKSRVAQVIKNSA